MGKQSPVWVDFDQSGGWQLQESIGIGTSVTLGLHAEVLRGPIDKNDPKVYRISFNDEALAVAVGATSPEQAAQAIENSWSQNRI
jgi:hypothetical protein